MRTPLCVIWGPDRVVADSGHAFTSSTANAFEDAASACCTPSSSRKVPARMLTIDTRAIALCLAPCLRTQPAFVVLVLCPACAAGPILGHITIDYMFDWGHINFKAKLGWLNWMTHILNSVAAAGVLAWIVSNIAADRSSYGRSCRH